MQNGSVTKVFFFAVAAGCLTIVGSSAAAARGLDTWRDPDPGIETAGQTDARFAAACRASAQERLGPQKVEFDRPSYAIRDRRQIVRIDLVPSGERRDPDRVFRAVCVRDASNQPVDAMVFDGPADNIGPRVVMLPGPTPEMRPRPAPQGNDPGGSSLFFHTPGYEGDDSYWLPGLGFPTASGRLWRHRHFADRTFSDRAFVDKIFRDRGFVKKQRDGVLEKSRGPIIGFSAPRAKSSGLRLGSPATTRMGTGVFIR